MKCIFTDDYCDVYSEIKNDIEEFREIYDEPSAKTEDLVNLEIETRRDDFKFELKAMAEQLGCEIFVVGDIGMWNGHSTGYEIIDGLDDIIYTDCDENTFGFDETNTLVCRGVHHDGVNNYKYYVLPRGYNKDELWEEEYGKTQEERINNFINLNCESLYPTFKKYYEWE